MVVTNSGQQRSIRVMRIELLTLALTLASAQSIKAEVGVTLRFRQQPFASIETPVAKNRSLGVINRVQYRFSNSDAGIALEREAVREADPQKETLAKPVAIAGAPWIRETVPPASGTKALAWADFDGDGSDELLVGWPVRILKHDAEGKWVELKVELKLGRADNIAIADVNHDGLADIIVADGPKTTVLLNESGLPWVRHVISAAFKAQTALAADFSGTGKLDVISGDIENDHKVFLFRSPDWKPTLLISGIRVIQSVAMDVNGDGYPDFVGAQYHPGLVFWLENPHDPSLPWKYHVIDDFKQGGIDGVHGLALADIEGAGHLDLVAASGWTGGNFPDSIVWFRAPLDPSTGTWERFVIANRDAPGFNHYPSAGDVNGDGKIDVASAAKSGPQGNWFAWWEHPATNPTEPWKKHLIAVDQAGATNIVIADLNGDGKPDFVGSRGHGRGVVWFEAPHWTPHELDTTLVGTHALGVGDLNGDGALDVVTCAKDSGVLAWFQNNGRGHFTQHRIYEDQSAYELRLVDMNGDGTPDILVAGQASGNVVWYENRLAQRNRTAKSRSEHAHVDE